MEPLIRPRPRTRTEGLREREVRPTFEEVLHAHEFMMIGTDGRTILKNIKLGLQCNIKERQLPTSLLAAAAITIFVNRRLWRVSK